MSPRYFHVPEADESSDDRTHFSRDDFIAAFALVCSLDEAERWTDELLRQPPPDNPAGYETHLSDDVLDLLSLVSDQCARRVQAILRISDEEAAARRARLRRKIRS